MHNDQQPLWYDTLESALVDVLRGVYGKGCFQKAAGDMYPTEDPIDKGKWLEKALDPERAEKLGINDIIWIMKLGRQHGLHGAMYFLADEVSYSRPAPIEPKDQIDEQMRMVLTAAEQINGALEKIERFKKDMENVPAFLRRMAG